MSFNFGSPTPIQPLSLGNTVSAGLRLYRSHLKDYFLLALKAYVWLLVPIYGWAKFYALISLISRLAFAELVNQPESISSAQRRVNSKLWQFLFTMLLMFFINIGIICGVNIVSLLLSLLSRVLLGSAIQGNTATDFLMDLITIIINIATFIALSWLFTRFYLVDLPLAIEDDISGLSTIGRSWELTQGHVWRIFLINCVTFVITVPIQVIVQITIIIFMVTFSSLLSHNPAILYLVLLVFIALIFCLIAVVLPFWQSIKAVIYYDLRSRREGLGLKLRDHDV